MPKNDIFLHSLWRKWPPEEVVPGRAEHALVSYCIAISSGVSIVSRYFTFRRAKKMFNHWAAAGFVFCTIPTVVKGLFDLVLDSFHHPRIVVLAVAGLAGMYMVHLLADDYNTYQSNNNRPPQRFLGKRSIMDNIFGLKKNVSEAEVSRANDLSEHVAKLDMIYRFDPIGCARKYVCTVATKQRKKMTKTEKNVIDMVRGITKKGKSTGGDAFRAAMRLGFTKKDPGACGNEYPKCIFTVPQMLRLMNWF